MHNFSERDVSGEGGCDAAALHAEGPDDPQLARQDPRLPPDDQPLPQHPQGSSIWEILLLAPRDGNESSLVLLLLVPQYAQSCTSTLWSRHSRLIFSGKWKTTTHITRWKCMTIQFTTWFWWHTWASMYEICLNTLSVVSIDYSVFIFSYRFGLAVLFLCRDHKVPVQLCAYCGHSIVVFIAWCKQI